MPIDVHVASDGEKAIDFIVKSESDPNAPVPDFVLLDLNLPRIDGFEILKLLRSREKYKTVPVLIITSSDSPSDRRRAAELGAAYFRKPPSYEDFMKLGGVLRQLLKDHRII